MRTQLAGRRGINHAELANAIRAGHGPAIMARLSRTLGIALDANVNSGSYRNLFPRQVIDLYDDKGNKSGQTFGDLDRIAFDAQPEMITIANAGIPAFLSNYFDPNLIEVLQTPMKAAEIAGETKKGDWVTTVTTFGMIESVGEVSAYGDYNNGGNADVNSNFPQRQSFHYQTITQWGEKELAYNGLASIDLASRKNVSSALVLNKFQNLTYFYGVAGLQNYGLLNDPALLPPIIPLVNWTAATAEQIFTDFVRIMQTLISQGNGTIDAEVRGTVALSPMNAINLNKTNQYNVNVFDQIAKNFPGLRFKTAPEYNTASGELVQIIVDEVEGQETLTAAFTEKMRAHAMVIDLSSWKQKKSQGTWGTVIYRPVFVASMLG